MNESAKIAQLISIADYLSSRWKYFKKTESISDFSSTREAASVILSRELRTLLKEFKIRKNVHNISVKMEGNKMKDLYLGARNYTSRYFADDFKEAIGNDLDIIKIVSANMDNANIVRNVKTNEDLTLSLYVDNAPPYLSIYANTSAEEIKTLLDLKSYPRRAKCLKDMYDALMRLQENEDVDSYELFLFLRAIIQNRNVIQNNFISMDFYRFYTRFECDDINKVRNKIDGLPLIATYFREGMPRAPIRLENPRPVEPKPQENNGMPSQDEFNALLRLVSTNR